MIWTGNHGQRPAGNDTGKTYTAPNGAQYEVWVYAGTHTVSTNAQTVTFARKTNVTSGSVDLSGFFSYLKSNDYTSSSAGIDQIDFGTEIARPAALTSGSPSARLPSGQAAAR